jgi:amidase
MPSDLPFHTATQLAQAIQARQITAVEALEVQLERIARINPRLNAIVTLDETGARQRARDADAALAEGALWGPLHGVPITVKDSFETAGMRTVSGYPPFANRIPLDDAPPVARLRQAGAIILGKTNLPTLASGIQTDNPVFGRTNNPWDVTRTPGGSSGGAAAAISAGLSFLELGSDIGGSIRIPAHFCGIYGLKATGGRISGKGHLASPKRLAVPAGWEALLQLASMGPLARSIDDLRLAFPILAEPGTPGLTAVPGKSLAQLCAAWSEDFGGAPLDGASRAVFRKFMDDLVRGGCQVEKRPDPGIDYDEAWYVAGICLGTINTLFQPPLTRWLRRILMGPILSRSQKLHPLQRGLYAGVALNHARVVEALAQREKLIEQIEAFLGEWDAWICPVFPTPAFTHRPLNAPIEVDGTPEALLLANLLHCILFNLTGHPVVTVPIGLTAQGLPVGVQVVGRKWQEMTLLNTAEKLAAQTAGYVKPPLQD